jgi:hypothetical protein
MFSKEKLRTPLKMILGVLVVITTVAVVAHASIVTFTPHAAKFTYSLSPGSASSAVLIPGANQPTLVMGDQLTVGYRGIGQVSLLRVQGQFLEWVGLESPYSAAVTSGYGSTFGQHIVYIDWVHNVDIEVVDADHIRVHNSSTSTITATGNVKLIW